MPQLCKNIHRWVLHPLVHADPTIVVKSELYLESEKKIHRLTAWSLSVWTKEKSQRPIVVWSELFSDYETQDYTCKPAHHHVPACVVKAIRKQLRTKIKQASSEPLELSSQWTMWYQCTMWWHKISAYNFQLCTLLWFHLAWMLGGAIPPLSLWLVES